MNAQKVEMQLGMFDFLEKFVEKDESIPVYDVEKDVLLFSSLENFVKTQQNIENLKKNLVKERKRLSFFSKELKKNLVKTRSFIVKGRIHAYLVRLQPGTNKIVISPLIIRD